MRFKALSHVINIDVTSFFNVFSEFDGFCESTSMNQ